MKKLAMLLILTGAFASCNVPKEGEEEKVPTSKLEILTELGDDTAKVAADSTDKH